MSDLKSEEASNQSPEQIAATQKQAAEQSAKDLKDPVKLEKVGAGLEAAFSEEETDLQIRNRKHAINDDPVLDSSASKRVPKADDASDYPLGDSGEKISDESDQESDSAKAKATLDSIVDTIPPHLWRAAMWQQQFNNLSSMELATFWEKDPATAELHFSGYHEAMNRFNSNAAEAGRKHLADVATRDPVKVPEMVSLETERVAEQLNISEEAAAILTTPLNAALENVRILQTQLKDQRAENQQTQQVTLLETVSEFFQSKAMKEFKDFYGEQFDIGNANVQKVLVQADAIRSGYEMQGQKISPVDALQMAHDGISAPIVQDKIRQQLRQELTDRAAGATHKPSHTSGKSGTSKDAKSQKLQKGLSEIFG